MLKEGRKEGAWIHLEWIRGVAGYFSQYHPNSHVHPPNQHDNINGSSTLSMQGTSAMTQSHHPQTPANKIYPEYNII
jgi:hypothetical protein